MEREQKEHRSKPGWPNNGGDGANKDNARNCNTRLTRKINGNNGTPITTYIFALFNENQTSGEQIEKYWGLLNPDGSRVYTTRTNERGTSQRTSKEPSIDAMEIPRVKLGSQGMEVSQQGLGCMGMSAFYGAPKPEGGMINLIHKAVALGITFLDTADAYGPHTNEILVGKAIAGIRNKVQIATKFGISSQGIRGDPAYVRECCEGSLSRLGIDCIDLYYQHRPDLKVPIEITVGEMKKLVEEGKVKYLGLSEVSSLDIRRAHAVHPITAVQLEWSLWTRDIEEDVVPTCRELGIGIVSYSPLGRGFLSMGKAIMEGLPNDDFRKVGNDPRLMPEHIDKNMEFYKKLCDISTKKNCSPGQLALAWLHHHRKDVVPIPGTTQVKNLLENVNALSVKLSKEELEEIEVAIPAVEISGERKKNMALTWKYASTPALESYTS